MSVFALLPFLAPVPAMLVYSLKTEKINSLTSFTVLGSIAVASLLCLFKASLHYPPTLILQYVVLFNVGLLIFRRRFNYPQAASIAYCLLFFNIFYWETPVYIFSFLATRQYTAWTNLAPLGLYPIMFVCCQIGVAASRKKTALLFFLGLFVAALLLIPAVANNWLSWMGGADTIKEQAIHSILQFFSRFFCYFVLLKAFYPGKSLNTA